MIAVPGQAEAEQDLALLHMLEAAQRFLDCHDRVRAQAGWGGPQPPPGSLAAAIARDFAGFELEQAEADFRAALAALSGGPPIPAPSAAAPVAGSVTRMPAG